MSQRDKSEYQSHPYTSSQSASLDYAWPNLVIPLDAAWICHSTPEAVLLPSHQSHLAPN